MAATAKVAPIPFLDLIPLFAAHRVEFDRAWTTVLGHGVFIGGPEVARFEEEFAAYCGVGGAVGVANGTDALELVLAALGIGPGDEVLLPTNTFVATAEAVCAVGAVPRFVDVRPDTLLVDLDAAAAAVTARTAAIIAVHLFGQVVDPKALLSMAQRYGLVVIEDAAQAHGATFDGRRAGNIGVAAAFSFYPGKNLGSLGDGGAVVSNDWQLLEHVRMLANHGRSTVSRHRHDARGRNSRLDTLQAALLSVRLRDLDAANARRTVLMAHYRTHLPPHVVPVTEDPRSRSAHHLAVVLVDDRDALVHTLDAAGVGWGLHYPVPCHRQPAFAEFAGEPLPVAEAAAQRLLSLPMSPRLTYAQVDRVCTVLASEEA